MKLGRRMFPRHTFLYNFVELVFHCFASICANSCWLLIMMYEIRVGKIIKWIDFFVWFEDTHFVGICLFS